MKILFIDDTSMSTEFFMWQTDTPEKLIDELRRQEHGDGNQIESGEYLYGTDTETDITEEDAITEADKVVDVSDIDEIVDKMLQQKLHNACYKKYLELKEEYNSEDAWELIETRVLGDPNDDLDDGFFNDATMEELRECLSLSPLEKMDIDGYVDDLCRDTGLIDELDKMIGR